MTKSDENKEAAQSQAGARSRVSLVVRSVGKGSSSFLLWFFVQWLAQSILGINFFSTLFGDFVQEVIGEVLFDCAIPFILGLVRFDTALLFGPRLRRWAVGICAAGLMAVTVFALCYFVRDTKSAQQFLIVSLQIIVIGAAIAAVVALVAVIVVGSSSWVSDKIDSRLGGWPEERKRWFGPFIDLDFEDPDPHPLGAAGELLERLSGAYGNDD